MNKIFFYLLFLTFFASAAVVSPSQSSIAILLDASGLCHASSSDSWQKMQVNEFLKNNAFYGNPSFIYCHSYDASINPSEAVASLFIGKNSIFNEALKKWSQDGYSLNSEVVPHNFIIIAEGVAGLAVREYIQSKNYQGEIDNVIFFNTPHEGTGFADQSLLNGSPILDKSKSVSDYSDIIPLALTVYLVGGGAALEDLMMSLLKEAVLGMAQNAGAIKNHFESFFDGADKSYSSLLYLAQDLDLEDKAYSDVKKKAINKGLDLTEFVGSTQLLNSYSKLNSFEHPAYNNVYSYGLPTIGNGRRTLADFAEQPKNHVSKEKLKKMLAESISATLEKNGLVADLDEINNIVSNAMHNDFVSDAMNVANQVAIKYDIPVGQISECVQDVSSLSKLKFNKENLSKSVLTIISIANKYLPEKYKSELFSTFMDEYSKSLISLGEKVAEIKGDLKKGMNLISNNLTNYAINFFDEGTYDVPAFSAIGQNVQAFSKSSVSRYGYSLKDYVQNNKTDYEGLNKYLEYATKVGELEGIRQDVDLGLKIGCGVAEVANPGAGKACRAAQFVANVALIAKISSDIENAVKQASYLRLTKYVAVKLAMERKLKYGSWNDHKGISHNIESSDMESMLFGTPVISLQTVRKKGPDGDSIVPLALYKMFDNIESYLDISRDSASFGYLIPESEFSEIKLNDLVNSNSVMMKDVLTEWRNGFLHKDAKYAALEGFVVRDFIKEYRFIIDDFQPDKLRLIKLDFNGRTQIAYERIDDCWYIYRGVDNIWEKNPIDTLSEPPVQKNGLFVFRPKDVINRGITDKNDSLLLSAIQEDGANNVSIYIVNKVGKANNQRITFRFQAVDYLIEEGWPKSFEIVSRMDTVSMYSNDLGYGASLGKYRLIISNLESQDTVNVMVDSLEGAGNRYRFFADLSSVWKKHPLKNTSYTLKWDLGFNVKTLKENGSIGEQTISYNPQVIVWGDVSAPKLAFDTAYAPKVVSLNNDGILAYAINLDSADNRVLRGLRSYMVRKSIKDTLLYRAYVGEPSYEIRWNKDSVVWSDSVELYVQAYDLANPNSAMKSALLDVVGDSAKSSWSLVMDNDSVFKSGINGVSIHKTILVDNDAPQVTRARVTLGSFVDASLPQFSKQTKNADLVLNAMDTLMVSFDIEENLLGRNFETLTVELVFKDSLGNDEIKLKKYFSDFVVSNALKHFVFEEPDVNRLEDGVYSLSVSLTDEAGNKSYKRIMEKLRVDRTSPQVHGISLGDVAYENLSELKKGTAHLSQNVDDVRNRSDLACYLKVNVNDKIGKWMGPFTEKESRTEQYSNYEFDIRSVISDTNTGFWYVYFGCFDDAGNFGKNMNFMGIGSRYPKITYPKNGDGSYSNQILIRGIAPNPDVHGNSNEGEFNVSWRRQGDSTWFNDGISYLVFDKSLAPTERDLAIWNTAKLNLEGGDFVLRLSVRSCDSCEWVSNERTVLLDDFIYPNVVNSPQIEIVPPIGSHVSGHVKDVTIELKNVLDTSKWFVSAVIEAPSSRDSTVYIKAFEKNFDPIMISPFKNPALASDTGLSIWQEDDDSTWHVRYVGSAKGIEVRKDSLVEDSVVLKMTPYIAIRFVDGKIDWNDCVKSDSTESLGFVMDSIKIKNEFVDMIIPPYNVTKMWKVDVDSVHLTFKTKAPFSVDASSIEGALYRDSLSPVVYVFPERYKAHVLWNGLVNGASSRGSLVKMNVVAYEKGNEKNVVSQDAEWYLEYENTGIEISSSNLNQYYVNFLGSVADSTEIKLGDYGFQFKLTGRSAYVTAKILDSTKKEVHTLLDSEFVVATSTNQWKTLRWNGIKDDGLVQTGSYNIHLLVEADTGVVVDTLYPFVISLGDNVKEARSDSVGRTADLKMLEATLDSDGKYRYVGKPDYILRTNVSATILPKEERVFNYEWDVVGTQRPVVYKKTRPSLGIRRHRDEFWATVVTLVIGETRDYNGHYKSNSFSTVCDEVLENNEYHYKIQVQRKQFKKGVKIDDVIVDLDPENNKHNDWHIYGFRQKISFGYNAKPQFDTLNLKTLVAVKILPASSYDDIVRLMGYATSVSGNAIKDADKTGISIFSWDSVYDKNSYPFPSPMKDWFDNWNGQALYYEAVNENFAALSRESSLNTVYDSAVTKTSCDTENINAIDLTENNEKFVCGATKAKDEVDRSAVNQFNPHAYMMNVKIAPVDGKVDFVDKNYDEEHCSYGGSGTDIKVKFVLEVNPDYWNPKVWGTNNLANRYVRFDPVNKTLYGEDGYITKLANENISNFYNGSKWITDASLNNGPTIFEAQRLPMVNVPENPLLFNDELNVNNPTAENNPAVKYYPSEFSWRFYRGSGDVNYKAVARNLAGTELTSFNSDSDAAKKGQDLAIKKMNVPYDIYFDVAPMMTFNGAKNASIIKLSKTNVEYPLKNSACSVNEEGYRFYGCDKWVSRLHANRHDWSESQWDSVFILSNKFIRNPVMDASAESMALTSVESPQNTSVSIDQNQSYIVDVADWDKKEKRWSFELNKTDSDVDGKFGGISIGKYVLNPYHNTGDWCIDSSASNMVAGIYKVFNMGKRSSPSQIDFYRSRDTVFSSERSLNNRLQKDVIPLSSVVAQSLEPADTILISEWSKNQSAEVLGVYKRNLLGDAEFVKHPYLVASYDSVTAEFAVIRNTQDIYASREDEIVTLRGSVPYSINNWNISYIQNGMRFKVAEGAQEPIEAYMNINELQGNTSFFLTYSVLGDITYYRQLDVHIGERIKASEKKDVYSMYGNVHIHFDDNAWEKDEDVTVRTINPNECYDCELFRNVAPVGPVLEVLPSHVFPEGKEPLITIDISVKTLADDGLDYRNLKIYKLDSKKTEIVPLEIGNAVLLLNSDLNICNADDWHSCAFVRINAKTPTFSKFVVLDSLKAGEVTIADSIPEVIEQFNCSQMNSLWMDTLWMGSANGWLEFPYLCKQKSNYLLQLSTAGNVSAEHRGASASPIIWPANILDFNVRDSIYQSSVVLYGVDGTIEQKLGPVVKMDSIAPVVENMEVEVSENEEGQRLIHVETEINEVGSGIERITMELFFGGSLLQSVNILENALSTYDFKLENKELYACIGCKASVKVIVEDKGHNSNWVVKQTEKIYPYPSSLVLWYPFAEGSGDIGFELMTKDDSKRMHMDLSTLYSPWNGRYGVHLYKAADSASSRYRLSALDSLRPFSFEFNYNAGNTQNADWSILSFVGKNEWTFGIGTYNRYFLKIGTDVYYFNTKRDASISTHLFVVVDGKNASLYKNGEYVETLQLGRKLLYGGDGKLSIGTRHGMRSAVGNISNLRFYSSALSKSQIQDIYNGILSDKTINFKTVRAVSLTSKNGLMIDQSCSAPGKAYLRQKSIDNSGIMTWPVDLKADNYSLYILHGNYISEDSRVEIFVNEASIGTFKLTSSGLWKSEKVTGITLDLKAGVNKIGVRPLGNLGVVALALVSTNANVDAGQIGYNESSWTNPIPKVNVSMVYEDLDDKQWAKIRFDLRNMTDKSLENTKIRYYYKGEGENVNALAFYPGVPMRVVNDAGSVFYAEFALTEPIMAYGTAYFNHGPLIGLHRLTSPNNYFPYWDKTDDPSYLKDAETEYVNATGIALLDSEGNLLNEFACYDEDGPMQKARINILAMAKDNSEGSTAESDLTIYVENSGSVPVDTFEVRYYYRDTTETELDIYWNVFAKTKKVNAGGDLHYISFTYDVILNSGDKSDYGSGIQFSLHHPNRTSDFNANDDPSHYNLNNHEMITADSIVILDKRGNLLWGNVPQPKFNQNYITKESYSDLIHREGNMVYIEINEAGHYVLETVNAVGLPLITLYNGIWVVGEHAISLSNYTISAGSYLVLRKGSEIVSWKLIN